MKMITHHRLLWLTVIFLILVNSLLLGRALYNRLPPANAHITLSERELASPYRYGFYHENSGMNLDLRWRIAPQTPGDESNDYWDYNSALSLSAEQFASFDFPACAVDEYSSANKHTGWVLLELNGQAMRRYQQNISDSLAKHLTQKTSEPDYSWQRLHDRLNERITSSTTTDTRLFAIGAHTQQQPLQAQANALQAADKHASYIILPAEINDSYERCNRNHAKQADATENATKVSITLINDSFHVPSELIPTLTEQEHFSLRLSLGRFNEAWLSHSTDPKDK